MKKLNACLAIITTFLLVIHTISMSLLATGIVGFYVGFAIVGVALTIVFCIHVVLSLCIIMFMTDRGDVLKYSNNSETKKQRISAIVMIILIHVHASGKFFCEEGVCITKNPKMIILMVLEMVLIDAVFMHCGMSVRRALITLGITTDKKAITRAKLVSKIVFIALEILAMIATIIYAF